jgi:DNA mismatch repair protein MutS2
MLMPTCAEERRQDHEYVPVSRDAYWFASHESCYAVAMNEHTLRVLEFHKVTGIVAGFAASEPGRAAVLGLLPSGDAEVVKVRLRETNEYIRILQSGEKPPLDGIVDIRPVIEKLEVTGIMLLPNELLNTAQTLCVGRKVKQFFRQFEGKGTASRPPAPLLCAKAAAIQPLKHIEDAVASAIDENAEVKDSASPELRKVRRQIAKTRDDILGHMSGILQTGGFQKIIQEPVITIRDDRYVLPLKPNFRQSLKGVVHGQSGSRSTLFVEPLDVLEQNNRLAELRMEEHEEVERVLRTLTALVAPANSAVAATCCALTDIDAVHARARFGIEFQGVVPAISTDGAIRLYSAKHPLLAEKHRHAPGGRSVTLNNVELSAHERALVLSGPNAGGKTVILKTVGLLSLMAQSGLPVTAAEESELPCFSSIFADIGDEQSLEQDLSTFSSHMSQIAEILRLAENGSLVILDELGSGTEPGEGAALGAAVIEGLIERGAITLVTTHHNALKHFGSQRDGAINAAMEFDLETLQPTYRLIAGRPGRSYGLDMATRLGVPQDVVMKARERLGADDSRLDDLLKQVEVESCGLAATRAELDKQLAVAKQEREETALLLRTAREEASAIKTKARQETRDAVSALRKKLRELSNATVLDRAAAKTTAAEVEAITDKLAPDAAGRRTACESVHTYAAGDRVRVQNVKTVGVVLGFQRGMLEIEVGGKKIRLSSNEVSPVEAVSQKQRISFAPGWSADLREVEGAPDRLNILGFHVDEGLAEVDRFIDRARIDGFSVVTIIHGLGTGALKKAVVEWMKGHPLIASIRPGESAEGGAGVTVAELKK